MSFVTFESRFTPQHRNALPAEHRKAYDDVVACIEEREDTWMGPGGAPFEVVAADGSCHPIRGSDLVYSCASKRIVIDTVLEGQQMKTIKSLKGIMAIQPWQDIMKRILEAQGDKVRVSCVCLCVLIVLCIRLILRSRPCSSRPTRSSTPRRSASESTAPRTLTLPRSRARTAWTSCGP